MKKSNYRRYGAAITAASAMMLGAASVASAAEVIKFTVASAGSPQAGFNKAITETFIPEVDRILAETGNYEIEWNPALNGTLAGAPNLFEAVEEQIADLALAILVFENAKLPLQMVSFAAPFGVSDCVALGTLFHNMQTDIPEMQQAWEDHNQVFLGSFSQDSYNLWSKVPVNSIEDLEGLKVGSGNANSPWLGGTGAVHVSSTLPRMYNEMSTGVFDAALMSSSFGGAFKFYEVAPYLIKTRIGGTNAGALNINKTVYDGLPEEVQNALHEAGLAYTENSARASCGAAAFFEQKVVESGGTIIELPLSERQKWAMGLPNLGGDWADGLESQGLPGRQVLTAYMDALRNGDEEVLRNWDE